ncbi:hypothetical protein GCM10007276_27670 [Agaricicola taiwanensis]|uniref:Right handed beta helix domain-containing protein n=1 Tax=Agaricicola taiwanensis TaxID=591372 RepID=A0A8J3DY23_9RHOB|nr:right-handed parallel beta-helix repeat-containing protein [Agaricicola taiwanensis]GGE49016.1 hypothetical protein GCM10007276_27670 [Agaricicola taiwanensis]
MAYNDITKMTPTSTIWVQAGAAAGGDGSQDRPFSTIQQAVSSANPGTAIMVRAGTYVENVKLPISAGTDTAPIWLVSADGIGAAHIIAKSATAPVIKGLGTDNYMIDGFTIEGGSNGIQLSQSGSAFTNMVQNIVLSNNTIINSRDDGIKISQADNVQILHNNIVASGDQGIDFVAVNDSTIIGNEVSRITGASAIFAKGGSTNVEISGNYVHDVAVDGIILGGWTEQKFFRPGFDTYEAKNITVSGNYVEGVGKRPVNILGAIESEVSGNILHGNPDYPTVVNIENGSPSWTDLFNSHDILIENNVFDRTKGLLTAAVGNRENIVFIGNATDGQGSFDFASVGPGAQSSELPDAAPPPAVFTPEESATLKGSSSADIFDGGDVNNKIAGRGGADLVLADGGNDQIFMTTGKGAFFVDGGEGIDTLRLDAGDTAVNLSLDLSYITKVHVLSDGSAFTNVEQLKIYYGGSTGTLNVTGGELSDIIFGGEGKDIIYGGGGNDWLRGGTGDKLYGGAGNDRLEISGTSLKVDGGAGTDTLTISGKTVFSATSLSSIEKFFMTGGADIDFSAVTKGVMVFATDDADAGVTVTGTNGNDAFRGTNFADQIFASFGNDAIKGYAGDDYINGGDGNDTLTGGAGNDTIYGGGDFDTVVFSGKMSDYSISRTDTGDFLVSDLVGDDGQDAIFQVEQFTFSDGYLVTSTIL